MRTFPSNSVTKRRPSGANSIAAGIFSPAANVESTNLPALSATLFSCTCENAAETVEKLAITARARSKKIDIAVLWVLNPWVMRQTPLVPIEKYADKWFSRH
jgi:hypothetical protein